MLLYNQLLLHIILGHQNQRNTKHTTYMCKYVESMCIGESNTQYDYEKL